MSKAKIALFGVLGAAVITGVFGLVQASIGPDGGSGGGKGGGSSRVPSTSSPESSPTSPSSAKTGPATEPKPVEYKGVDIPYGYALRFADEPVKPFEPEVGVNYEDLGWDSDGFYSSGTLVLLEESQEGSLSTCKGNTRYTDHVPQERVLKGSQVCIITEAGHVGLVTMRDTSPKDSPSEYVTVDLSVWHNAVKPEDEG